MIIFTIDVINIKIKETPILTSHVNSSLFLSRDEYGIPIY